MKKIYSIAMIAACAMMVFSCKNNGKGNDEEIPTPAEEAVEAVENAADAVKDAAKDGAATLENAAKDAAKRADDAIEKLGDIVPYTAVEVKPQFEGGDADAFVKYIQKNIKYPQSAIDNDEQGRVTVNFIVDANGKITNAKVVKGVSEALDAEALRVINSAPAWTPAKQGGKAVPVTYSVPVNFTLR